MDPAPKTTADDPDPLLVLVRTRGLLTDDQLAAWRAAGGRLLQWMLRERIVDAPQASALVREASGLQVTWPSAARRDEAPALDRLGRYALVRELARGGMGVVYEALDERLGRRVALKALSAAAPGEILIRRLQREASVAARLAHPGIIAIHEVGQAPGPDGAPVHYLVMDLVQGRDLAAALPELDRARRLDVLLAVADALAAAHAAGIVHRDLKPANILLRASDGRPVLTDFGLARLAEGTRLTWTGAILGTALYMAPEQVAGDPDAIDARADVWALGVLLFELLSDRLPFEADSAAAQYELILHASVPPPSRFAEVPGPLEAVCLGCLERRPADRFADAAAVADALRRALAGEVVARPAVARRRRRLGAALLLGLALLAGLAALVVRAARRADDALRRAARAAYAAGRWEEAAATASRVGGGDDPQLRTLIADCRERVAAARADQARQQASAADARALQAALRPLRREIDEARAAFHDAAADPVASRRRLEAAAVRLAELTRDPRHARAPAAWTELGVAQYLAGRPRRAEPALRQAIALDPDARRAHYYLGRLLVEQAMARRLGTGRQRQTGALGVFARHHFERARGTGWAGARPVERQLVQVYEALAAGDRAATRRLCEAGLRAHGVGLDAERFHLLLAFSASGPARQRHLAAALALRPHSPWAYFLRGSDRLLAGDAVAAQRDLDVALQLAPEMAVALVNRAEVHRRAGRRRHALADLDRAWDADPTDAMTLNNRGNLRSELDDLEGALADFDRALKMDPDLALVHLNRGNVLHKQGRADAAGVAYAVALKLDPTLALAWSNRGILRLSQGDAAGAVADFSQAVTLLATRPKPVRARAHLMRARARQHAGDIEGALADFARGIELEPTSGRGELERGTLLATLGRQEAAGRDLRRAVELAPRHVQSWLALAQWQIDQQQLAAAGKAVARALTLAPRSVDALTVRSVLRQARGDLDGARADLDRALTLKPDTPPALCKRALLRARTGDLPGALADLDRALALAPRNAIARHYRANILAALGRTADALADYDRAIALSRGPQRGGAHYNRAQLLLGQGHVADAETDLQAAVADSPRMWQAWLAYGRVLYRRGRPADGLRAIRRARREAPPTVRPQIDRIIAKLGG